jgi:hypothetical protein
MRAAFLAVGWPFWFGAIYAAGLILRTIHRKLPRAARPPN